MIIRYIGRLGGALGCAAALILYAGCAGSGDDLPRESLAGTVTLDGAPLPTGTITFAPSANTAGVEVTGADTIQNGKFSIGRDVGLVPGSYKVSIYAADKPPERTKPEKAGAGKPSELAKQLIPAKYNSKTELTAEIKKGGGNDQMTFALQSK
jgi:hypothetical protein